MDVIIIDSSSDDENEEKEKGAPRTSCLLAAERRIAGIAASTTFIPTSTLHTNDTGYHSDDSVSIIWDAKEKRSKKKKNSQDSERRNIHDQSSDNYARAAHLLPLQALRKVPPTKAQPLTSSLPNVGGTWRVVLLMDHREFGNSTDFLQETKAKINKHFGDTYADIDTLPSADYMFVARLISDSTGHILQERVLDMVIERKDICDLTQACVTQSKKFPPLSFFDAQMYKFQHNGISKKLFIIEGDEETQNVWRGANMEMEKLNRKKRIKTVRLRIERGEYIGVDLLCTRNRQDTIRFLIQTLEKAHTSFDPTRPPPATMKELKVHIDKEMKNATFLEYLRLRRTPGIGDKKAMKAIKDPKLNWDKSFVSPDGTSRPSKSTLADMASFWGDRPRATATSTSNRDSSKYSTSSSSNPSTIAMDAAFKDRQKAVKDFDESAEGKERSKLDKKIRGSKTTMLTQEAMELDDLNKRRESLTRERSLAKGEKNENAIGAAIKDLEDFDALNGKRRSKLMQKKRLSQVQVTQEEFAKLTQLNSKRASLGHVQTQEQKTVAECRRAAKKFDESAEGKERERLDKKNKDSKMKINLQDIADLDELNRQRASLALARDNAKREGNDVKLTTALEALADFDSSKNGGRKRMTLNAKKRASQSQMSRQDLARLKELNTKRRMLTHTILPDSSDFPTSNPRTTSLTSKKLTSTTTSTGYYAASRKRSPEQLYHNKRPKLDHQPMRSLTIDRIRGSNNPLHDADNSISASILKKIYEAKDDGAADGANTFPHKDNSKGNETKARESSKLVPAKINHCYIAGSIASDQELTTANRTSKEYGNQGWTCKVCTFRNENIHFLVCELCNEERS